MPATAIRSAGADGPPGSAERVGAAFRTHGDPVFVLHGAGVSDVFLCRDFQDRGIEEVLWEELRAAGFERIVFATAYDGFYYRDAASAGMATVRVSTRTGAAHGASGPGPDLPRRLRHFTGPQGDRAARIGAARSNHRPPGAGAAAGPAVVDTPTTQHRHRRPPLDEELVRTLRHLMEQTRVRTAVVLVRADQLLAHTSARRTLAESFGVWIAGPRTGNLCVLLTSQPERSRIAEEIRRSGAYPALAAWLDHKAGRGRAFGLVGPPPAAEIERAIQVARLRWGLRISDWPGLDRLAAAMAAEPETGTHQWLTILEGLADAGTPLDGKALARAGHLTGGPPDGRTAWERLDALTGLHVVKARIRALAGRSRLAAARPASAGPPPEAESNHLVFIGNPGTGKTEVAKLIGEIFRDIGVLVRGHTVIPEVSDLVTDHVGGAVTAMSRFVDEALDGVLFIDEAYRLTEGDSPFGMEAVNQLVSRMENERHRLVVIAAGYGEDMERFLRANTGLSGRFPRSNVLRFPDYGEDELLEILFAMLHRQGLGWEPETAEALRQVIAGLHRTRDARFSNARTMRELAGDLSDCWRSRVLADARLAAPDATDDWAAAPDALEGHADPAGRTAPGGATGGGGLTALWREPLLPADVPPRYRAFLHDAPPPIETILAKLDGLVGLGPVRDQLVSLHERLGHRLRIGAPGVVAPHLLFVGPPGTGKTTVAAIIGEMFHTLGLLPRPATVPVTRADLVAGFIGQTEEKTRAVIEKARGGVLFIDEAYTLASHGSHQDFGRVAIDTLVPAMEELRGQLVVIAAGYPGSMDDFLAMNVGLPGRFTERVEFPDYSPDDLVTILEGIAGTSGYRVNPAARPAIAAWFRDRKAAEQETFANARTARDVLFPTMERRLIARVRGLPDDTDRAILTTFLAADVPS